MTSTVRLGDVGSTYGGLTGKSKADFGRGDASFVTFLEVINSTRLRGRALGRVRVGRGERQNRVMRGDLLFNGSSETPDEVALSAVVDFEPETPTFLNSFCFGFRLRPGAAVEPAYLAYLFRSSVGRSLVAALAQGAIRYNIAKTKFLDVELTLPSVERQHEIVEALGDADEHIATLGRTISKKQAIKRGMMQQLLTGKTRLPSFTKEWADSTIRALANVAGGGTPSTRVGAYWGGGIPWFTPADIKEEGSGLVSDSSRTITHDGLANSAATLLPEGSVLVTSRASIGNCAVAKVPVATNQGFTSMIPTDRRSTWFLYYWVQQHRSELETRAAGSTFLEIGASKVAGIPLEVPTLDEQQLIGEALLDVDAELDALRRRIGKARDVRRGMAQELLSGQDSIPAATGAA